MNPSALLYVAGEFLSNTVGRAVAVAWRKVTGHRPAPLAIVLILAGYAGMFRATLIEADSLWDMVGVGIGGVLGLANTVVFVGLVLLAAGEPDDGDTLSPARTSLCVIGSFHALVALCIGIYATATGTAAPILILGFGGSALQVLGLTVGACSDPGGKSIWAELRDRRMVPAMVAA